MFEQKRRGFSPEEDLAIENIYFGDMLAGANKGKKIADSKAADRYRAHIIQYVQKFFSPNPMKSLWMEAVAPHPQWPRRLLNGSAWSGEVQLQIWWHVQERNPEPTDANLESWKKLLEQKKLTWAWPTMGWRQDRFHRWKWKFVQGDVSAAIIADHVLRQSSDKKKFIAVTIAFSNLIQDVAESLGAQVIYTPVVSLILHRQNSYAGPGRTWRTRFSALEWSREGPMLAGVMAGYWQGKIWAFQNLCVVSEILSDKGCKDSARWHKDAGDTG